MCGGNQEFTWDYVGTLVDGEKKYSIMANILQGARVIENCSDGNCESYSLGFHGIQFAFTHGDSTFFLNSTYGGDDFSEVTTALRNSVDWIYSTSTLENFQIDTQLIFSDTSDANWSVKSNGTSPVSPLYVGHTGQPGHNLAMHGEGQAFLWKIEKDGKKSVAKYNYAFDLEFTDERGVIGQGYGGGYVGPPLVGDGAALPAVSGITEYEIAQPRLKVTAWKFSIYTDGAATSGFDSYYEFRGTEGMLSTSIEIFVKSRYSIYSKKTAEPVFGVTQYSVQYVSN